MTKDQFGILNGAGEKEITLQKICDIMGIPVPEQIQDIKDIVQNDLAVRLIDAKKGCIFFKLFDMEFENRSKEVWLQRIEEKEIMAVFVDRELLDEETIAASKCPIIPVENLFERTVELCAYIKGLYDAKTIAVTGTVGKTTTMKFLASIVPKYFNTWINKGNANSTWSVAQHILNERAADQQMYIQETGARETDSIRKSAAMLNVDAFILLNVFSHHVGSYGSQENLLKDKASFDNYMPEDGVAVINYDDEMLAAYPFKHKVISFGIETEREVDYRASNIVQNGPILDMDVLHDGKTTHLSINILGTHNAYNALAAFALAKWTGLTDEEIVAGFAEYKSLGYRQNFRHLGGYDLLIDCYNCCEESLNADLKTIRELKVKDGKKRIAVISGENRLGDNADEVSYEMGRNLDLTGIEHVIVVGNDDSDPDEVAEVCWGRPLCEGIKSTGYENVVCVTNTPDLEKAMEDVIETGDAILFKGLYNLDFTVAIDNVFGTAISMNNPHYIKKAERVKHKDWKGRKFPDSNTVDLTGVKDPAREAVKIPNNVNGAPVHRVSHKLFNGNTALKELDLGSNLKHVGKFAFEGCTSLKKLTIPGNVKVIEEGAFKGCTSLKKLVVEEGVTHIESEAFSGCNLKRVKLPSSVKYVAETAFDKTCKIKQK